jgi:hypothetical protein
MALPEAVIYVPTSWPATVYKRRLPGKPPANVDDTRGAMPSLILSKALFVNAKTISSTGGESRTGSAWFEDQVRA